MATLQIRKKAGNVWEHIPSDGPMFILSDFYVKNDVNYFQIEEIGGSQRKRYLLNGISVYDDTSGGVAETFPNITALFERLKELDYPAFENTQSPTSVINDEIISLARTWSSQKISEYVDESFNNPDGFTVLGTISKIVDEITVTEGFQWIKNQNEYENTVPFVFNIDLEPDGYNRKAIIVANQSNGFEIIYGESSLGANTAIQPPTPIDKLFLTVIDIFGDTVNEPSEPINGALYYEKEYFSILTYSGTGVLGTIINGNKFGAVKFNNATTKFGGIQRNSSNYVIGQPFYIINDQSIPLEIEHLAGSPNFKFDFPNGVNYIAQPGEIVPFMLIEFGVYAFVGSINNSKRTETFRFCHIGAFNASTSWAAYDRGTNIFNPTTLVFDTYNNTTRVLGDGRVASFVIPFTCRIKRVYWQAGTYSNPITLNVHTFNLGSGSNTVDNQTLASKEFPLLQAGTTVQYSGAEIDTVSTIPAGKHITVLMFNNNLAIGAMRFNCLNVEIEEV